LVVNTYFVTNKWWVKPKKVSSRGSGSDNSELSG